MRWSYSYGLFALLMGQGPLALAQQPQLILTPAPPFLWGERLHLTAVGLPTDQAVRLRALRKDHEGVWWFSQAQYRSDAGGKVSSGESEALDGTYAGVDALGLFWSMTPVADTSATVWETVRTEGMVPAANTFYFALEVEGQIVARTKGSYYTRSPGVSLVEVREEDLVGNLILPAKNTQKTTVIWLRGAGGGVGGGDDLGHLLASKGYAVFSLAYFAAEGLPSELEEIPLEYFQNAIGWLQTRQEIAGNKLCLVGVSKGAELALLLGSKLPQIQGVVAYVPASVVWQGLNRSDWQSVKSSWTFAGKPLDFLPYAYTPEFYAQFEGDRPEKLNVFSLYEAALKDRAAVARVALAVERIQGEILLLSAGADQLWPSRHMSEMLVARLQEQGFPYPYRHVRYEGAGHHMIGTGYEAVYHETETAFYVFGGTAAATARARAESWREVQAFLAALSGKGTFGSPGER